jgi:hypothetical protein
MQVHSHSLSLTCELFRAARLEWTSVCDNTFLLVSIECQFLSFNGLNYYHITFNDGSLGSRIDDERSE